ncbi:MAG: SHOCT domain-containing protein [Bacteroidota bacterium]
MIGVYVFIWIIFALIVGSIGSGRKIGFAGAFLLSIIFSPLIGLIITLISPSESDVKYKNEMLSVQTQQKESIDKLVKNKGTSNLVDELSKAKKLLDEGVLSNEEFQRIKQDLLKGYEDNQEPDGNADTDDILTGKLESGKQIEIHAGEGNNGPKVGMKVTIEGEVPANGKYKSAKTSKLYEIQDGELVNIYHTKNHKTTNGKTITVEQSNEHHISFGDLVFEEGVQAADGIYKFGMFDSIKVKDGRVV